MNSWPLRSDVDPPRPPLTWLFLRRREGGSKHALPQCSTIITKLRLRSGVIFRRSSWRWLRSRNKSHRCLLDRTLSANAWPEASAATADVKRHMQPCRQRKGRAPAPQRALSRTRCRLGAEPANPRAEPCFAKPWTSLEMDARCWLFWLALSINVTASCHHHWI